jgi:hypothetical protein
MMLGRPRRRARLPKMTRAQSARFINALRECIGLGPIPHSREEFSTREGRRGDERETNRGVAMYSDRLDGRGPRGSRGFEAL